MTSDVTARCNAIEECYEFMLAYAAQGIVDEAGSQSAAQLRAFLRNAVGALVGLADAYKEVVAREGLEPIDQYFAFVDVLERDARSALAAVQLVLAQPSISSQLIDNLNASIQVRALLTDLFLIDEVLKGRANARGGTL
jgi:hypothetical protein